MLYLVWDEAHLWGVLMLRALTAWGLPVRLVRSHQIALGLLESSPPGALVVPGGFSSRKSASLGQRGLEAVRGYVAGGGSYLGICGGAGLGLTTPGGLGLCPWTRQPFEHRLQHFASGHVHLRPNRSSPYVPVGLPGEPLAPVWWPAKFRPHGRGVTVVASYGAPGPDFLMADIPLSMVPTQTLEDWEALYGVRLAPAFSEGDPCIVAGTYGGGRYVLSHAHLETPDSPPANAWLAHLLAELAGVACPGAPAPIWTIGGEEGQPAGALPLHPAGRAAPPRTPGIGGRATVDAKLNGGFGGTLSPRPPEASVPWQSVELERAMEGMLGVAQLGIQHGLLSWREPWLLGWRQGLPGAQLSGLLAMLDQARRLDPPDAARDFWAGHEAEFGRAVSLMVQGLSGYLLAERLALTLWRVDPQAVPERGLREARFSLFGPPPGTGAQDGGLCGRVLAILEEFIWLCAAE